MRMQLCLQYVCDHTKSVSIALHQVPAHTLPSGNKKKKKKKANVTPPFTALWCLVKVSAFKLGVGSVAN